MDQGVIDAQIDELRMRILNEDYKMSAYQVSVCPTFVCELGPDFLV